MTSKWPISLLAEVCDVKRGETITRAQTVPGSVPVIAGGLTPAYFHATSNRPSRAITVSGSGANAGSVAIWDQEIWASDCSTVISRNEELLQEFIYYYLKANENFIKTELRQGAAQPHVYAKDLAVLEIPIPPLDEQKRIVAKLDEALGGLDQITQNSKTALNQIDALWNSTLLQKLNHESRIPEPLVSAKWPTFSLAELCDVKRGETITRSQTSAGKVPVIAGGLNPAYFHSRSNRPSGTITVSGSGANAGSVAIWDEEIWASDCSTVISNNEQLLQEFIYYYLKANENFIKTELRQGAAQPHVYAKDLAVLQIPLPPLTEQKRIVTKLDHLKAQINELRKTKLESIEETNSLRSSVLTAAFSGEL